MKKQNLCYIGIITGILLMGNNTLMFGDNGDTDNPTTPPHKTRSISSCTISQNGYIVTLAFLANNGAVNITIDNEADDTVYDTTATAVAGTSLTIDTTGWESGTYTITVTSSAGVIYTTIVDIL